MKSRSPRDIRARVKEGHREEGKFIKIHKDKGRKDTALALCSLRVNYGKVVREYK